MQDHQLALKPGYVLEGFRIERVLGKGGFGITYLAVDVRLGKKVAIKELLPDTIATRVDGSTVTPHSTSLRDDWQWAKDRFIEEAKVLAGFSHPAIVGVHLLIEANGTVYIVMDYIEGESYEERLKRIGTEPDEESLMVVIGPVLEGLEEVHAKGLLHRDIKPGNILIKQDGQPVLIDFGAARESVGKTVTMTSMVTHGYSPIEQYQSKGKMGPWTDIYAVGAVMCRAMTGEKPPVAADRVMDDEFGWLGTRDTPRFSKRFRQGVDCALQVKPQDRPTAIRDYMLLIVAAKRDDIDAIPLLEFPARDPEEKIHISGRGTTAIPLADAAQAVEKPATLHWFKPWVAVVSIVLLGILIFLLTKDFNHSGGPQNNNRSSVEDEQRNFVQTSPDVIYKKAVALIEGRGVPKNVQRGIALLSEAGNAGLLDAQVKLGQMYEEGKGTEKNPALAALWFGKAADNGSAYAQFQLGWMHEKGRGVEKSDTIAVRRYRQAADQGYAKAQNNLASMYERGRGVAQDYSQAEAWYRKAADQGLRDAQANLGTLFMNSDGVALDDAKAAEWLKKAADQDDELALNNLGYLYQEGRGVPQDDVEAVRLYRKAADLGDPGAQYNVGWMYRFGRGVQQSDAEALKWYHKAAAQGDASAMNDIAWMIEGGRGADKDLEEAARWYLAAAEKGHRIAQFNIGCMYESGSGVLQNEAKATYWFRKAADQGLAEAKAKLHE